MVREERCPLVLALLILLGHLVIDAAVVVGHVEQVCRVERLAQRRAAVPRRRLKHARRRGARARRRRGAASAANLGRGRRGAALLLSFEHATQLGEHGRARGAIAGRERVARKGSNSSWAPVPPALDSVSCEMPRARPAPYGMDGHESRITGSWRSASRAECTGDEATESSVLKLRIEAGTESLRACQGAWTLSARPPLGGAWGGLRVVESNGAHVRSGCLRDRCETGGLELIVCFLSGELGNSGSGHRVPMSLTFVVALAETVAEFLVQTLEALVGLRSGA
ncbi:uncharacterized protein PG998_004260 [Apiospora kogelbergensis]|uniref:uncharacterized protein n=1 Tax=Apiospora kogelbergensis TaxID=1337665 RepID=UPI00312D593E